MATDPPVTQQIVRNQHGTPKAPVNLDLSDVENCLVYDRCGNRYPFKKLYQDKKTIIIFVRNFLCYTCKEYVEDLAKIPRNSLRDANVRLVVIGQSSYSHLESFCSLTRYSNKIYVDPERHIYKKLGMTRGELSAQSELTSPHVKSNVLTGSLRSIWRAMTSPAFDFQGDPLQQGGALIVGPGCAGCTPLNPSPRSKPRHACSHVHFAHYDMNRLDQMPINGLLQLVGARATDFSNQPGIVNI